VVHDVSAGGAAPPPAWIDPKFRANGGCAPGVGSRVEVVWDGGIFTAVVVKLYPTGDCDVVYEQDGSTGYNLRVLEHGLQLLDPAVAGQQSAAARREITLAINRNGTPPGGCASGSRR
jgi:hypothetical protein